ncbi:MAG: hypothetical protein M1825_005721 [Sarcosagium campestre]|nr:MAG: hypothetical protein M1825_005721 [Sarcosagium campestre]
MDVSMTVSDPSDWLATPLSSLATLETSLRCQVCKEFFATPMITECSHTFCSLCIRRCLTADGKCPTCRGTEQEVKLRRNWSLQEAVDAYQSARGPTLAFAIEHSGLDRLKSQKKRFSADVDLDDGEKTVKRSRTTRSQARREARSESVEPIVVIEDSEDADFQPEDGLVPCPMCGRRMKEESVYAHLDRCESERNHPPRTLAVHPSVTNRPPALQSKKRALTPLPKLNYSLYREALLRKKLTELGIRPSGTKPLMEKRHTEWVNLWNANCDADNPRTKRELLHELDTWERSQGGLAAVPAGGTDKGAGVMKKDFDGDTWARKHSNDFRKLVESARGQGQAAVLPAAAEPESGNQDSSLKGDYEDDGTDSDPVPVSTLAAKLQDGQSDLARPLVSNEQEEVIDDVDNAIQRAS